MLISPPVLAATLSVAESAPPVQAAPLAVAARALQHDGIWQYQWPGIYFDTELQGDSAYLRLPPGRQHLHISIDGQRVASLQPPLAAQYRLSDLGAGTHRLRVELVSEQQDGARAFGGVWLPTGSSATLPAANPRQIEFIGDSHTVGYGNRLSRRQCSADEIWASTDTGYASGALVARHYQADYRVHAISGRGVVRNYAGLQADTLPQAYPYQLFDHSVRDSSPAWQPQFIVLALGTNDFSTPLAAGERWSDRAALQADFVATYVAFIGALRQRHPQAQLILWSTGPADGEVRQANRAVLEQLQQQGEHRVSLVQLDPLSLASCDWHPSEADHQLIARRLIAQIDALAPSWPSAGSKAAPWQADLGNGDYRNPVLHADYSDPDAIRVGNRFYMTASSFSNVPGLPLLESADLVNWQLVGHALPELVPQQVFRTPQYGKGVWAPCLRYHDGRFMIFYPDPDFGIYVTEARDFRGPWSAPRLLLAGRGLIDPTPLWDDDGQAYLLHGWAFSRAGKNNLLTLRRMDHAATRILDQQGQDIIDGAHYPGYRTLEGPKFYKAHGYYYVFAPAGGVEQGWQAVFRARSIAGPYEVRRVLDQGDTPINGPHQGAWVDAPDGSHWFLHFQDKGAYGRVVHLQPMQWQQDWPLIGQPGRHAGTGQPVNTYRKPVAGQAIATPPSSDDFDQPVLGLQWQWGGNPRPDWYSLSARPGSLRLYTQAQAEAGNFVRAAPSILSQKLPASRFELSTRITLANPAEGDQAGLIINALQYVWLGLRRSQGVLDLVWTACGPFGPRCQEHSQIIEHDVPATLTLRLHMHEGAFAGFSYSRDGKTFKSAGTNFPLTRGSWVGAQVGLFSLGRPGSWLDVDYFHLSPADPGPY